MIKPLVIMPFRFAVILLVALGAVACRGRDPFAVERAALKVADRSAPDKTLPPRGAYEPGSDGLVKTIFENGRSRTLIHKDSNRTVYVAFDSEEGKTLRGNLYSKDPQANIRISQIIMPDGTTDGPFGWNITYELPESGTYRLAIHENMMAGQPWEGDFKVELALK